MSCVVACWHQGHKAQFQHLTLNWTLRTNNEHSGIHTHSVGMDAAQFQHFHMLFGPFDVGFGMARLGAKSGMITNTQPESLQYSISYTQLNLLLGL